MNTSLVSAPWADVNDIPAGTTTPPGGYDDLLADASEILFYLSGQQWRGVGHSKVQVLPVDRSIWPPLFPGWVPLPAFASVSPGWDTRGWGCWGIEAVKLPSTPVVSVQEVLIGDDALDSSLYYCSTAGVLERTDDEVWPADGSLRVTFTHGVAPPVGGVRACVALALELAKAQTDPGKCRLRNVESITREGVTVQTVNLRQALSAGRTGLYDVDLWIMAVNRLGMQRRGSAWSPDMGRARRQVT